MTRQREALREQRALAERLRTWREERRDAAHARNTKRRKAEAKASKGKRGVDRVPDRVKVAGLQPVWLVQHEGVPRSWRRAYARVFSAMPDGDNVTYVNPNKDRRLAGKARRRARRAAGATS